MNPDSFDNQLERETNNWNVADQFKTWSLSDIQQFQKQNSLPLSIAIYNLNGGLNVGTIIRTAVCFGVSKVFIVGKKKYDKRSTVGAHNYIEIENISEEEFQFKNWYHEGYLPICIETNGIDINTWTAYTKLSGKQYLLIFGNEADGLPESLTKFYPVVTIPQFGVIRSLNVSAAAAIAIAKIAGELYKDKDAYK